MKYDVSKGLLTLDNGVQLVATPKEIFLITCIEPHECGEGEEICFNTLEEVCWCQDDCEPSSIPYVRKDVMDYRIGLLLKTLKDIVDTPNGDNLLADIQYFKQEAESAIKLMEKRGYGT